MPFEDRTLVCAACGAEFLFSAGEQEFYEKKGFVHSPKRCKKCRGAREGPAAKPRGRPARGPRHVEYVGSAGVAPRPEQERARAPQSVEATCSVCGAVTRLPFRPDGVRPVFCRTCFQERKRHSSPSGRA